MYCESSKRVVFDPVATARGSDTALRLLLITPFQVLCRVTLCESMRDNRDRDQSIGR